MNAKPVVAPPTKLAYTVEEAAELLGVHSATIYRAVERGDFPARRLGRRIIIPRTQFDAYLAGSDDHDGSGG